MSCYPKPIYVPDSQGGINLAVSRGDGSTIAIQWDTAYPETAEYFVIYNIYYSSVFEDTFTEGVKYVALEDGYARIPDLTPGDTYYFAVKGALYQPGWWNPALLPDGPPELKILPEGALLEDISDSDTVVKVADIQDFPSFGVVQIGTELLRYSSKNESTNTLIISERGFQDTNIRLHQTDGYDGLYDQDPLVKFWKGFEDDNLKVFQETTNFSYPNVAFTTLDGYATQSDNLTTDESASDNDLADFPQYDGVGWHRTPLQYIIDGKCVGTYIGGEQFCADGYLGVGRQTRGIPLNEQAARREEELLSVTGEAVMLVRRLWEGIRCPCVRQTGERGANRCLRCFGTSFITGYQQFFNPRRSDGRILVQFGPAEEDIKFLDSGLENHLIYDSWTLPYPAIQDWDFMIRYDINGNEEFRYEVLNVTRNTTFNGNQGAQKFKLQRIRKTDPIYQWKAIASTATIPTNVITSVGMMAGPGGTLIPHTHEIVINEGIVSLSQVNQTTSVSQGHNHIIKDGIVQSEIGHSHTIIIP